MNNSVQIKLSKLIRSAMGFDREVIADLILENDWKVEFHPKIDASPTNSYSISTTIINKNDPKDFYHLSIRNEHVEELKIQLRKKKIAIING